MTREYANWNFQKVNLPPGWEFSSVLPYNTSTQGVDERAYLYHLPNNYVGQSNGFSTVTVEDLDTEKYSRLVNELLDRIDRRRRLLTKLWKLRG